MRICFTAQIESFMGYMTLGMDMVEVSGRPRLVMTSMENLLYFEP